MTIKEAKDYIRSDYYRITGRSNLSQMGQNDESK